MNESRRIPQPLRGAEPLRGAVPRGSAVRPRRAGRRSAVIASAVAIAIAATMLGASPAHPTASAAPPDAAGPVNTGAIEQVLRAAGVVADAPVVAAPAVPGGVPDAAPDLVAPDVFAPDAFAPDGAAPDAEAADPAAPAASTATVSVKAGLTVTAGANVVRMRPVLAGSRAGSGGAALSPSGLAVYGNGADSAFALGTAKTGANAGYVVVAAASAPTSYQFLLTVDGRPAVLRLAADGSVDVLDGAGTVVNSLATPWAKGADGAEVATSYAVAGNILTQTVEHHGASYPVIADPMVRCDGLWCTAMLTRAETRQMASGSFAPGALCAWFGAAGRICATLILSGWAHANLAINTGQCSGFRVWQRNLVSWPHLAYIPCYA